jgi:aminoglycoside phosphotransferase family enzyme/predicted kinase
MTTSSALRAEEVVGRLATTLGVGAGDRRETHGSWVLLTPTRAYKVKKPVTMAFLDYGSLEHRREMCLEEVLVNRRAAPGIYLGVRAIVSHEDGVALAAEDAPDAIEYAVEMRRFDEAETLAAALDAWEATPDLLTGVGRRIAAFHEACPAVPGSAGAEAVKRSVDDDFATLSTLLRDDPARTGDLVAAERFAAGFLGERWAELDARAQDGHVRDGHGDLRAEHVLLGCEPALVDAIEFAPGLRRIDVGLDLAFLVMELHEAERPDLADALVAGFRAAGGEPGDDRLLAFFAAYRARVRAKVALIRAAQLPAGATDATDAIDHAHRLLELSARLLWAARDPVVIVLAGVTGSGKSTLARALAARSHRPHLNSDVIRKRLAGIEPTARAPVSAYSPAMSEFTYRELGRLAGATAGTVIVDATLHRRRLRDVFREQLGDRAGDAVFVECRAPAAVLERRVRARARRPDRTSDATPEILRRQLADMDPFDEVPPERHVIIRADQPVELLVAAIEDAIGCAPARRRPIRSAGTAG